jgi:tetratricopeptide (TPR) repeat protein
MNRTCRALIFIAASAVLLGCASAKPPEAEISTPQTPKTPKTPQAPQAPQEASAPETPQPVTLMPAPVDASALETDTQIQEPALGWSDLTRLARDHQRRGELDEAERRLDQASTLVSKLAPTDARRRAVFGTRARFAEQLAYHGETERSDALADQLFAEAEAEPALGDTALVSLAVSVVDRRSAVGEEARLDSDSPDERTSQMRILRIALRTAQTGTANRDRLQLAKRVAETAFLEDELATARNAVDQAIADTATLAPTNAAQIAELSLLRARIANRQGDFERAIADATRANQIADERGASASFRGYGEATLAEALARSGEPDRALAIGRGARARLDGDEPIEDHAQRIILTSLARIEVSIDHAERARLYYDEALEVPGDDSDEDRHLVRAIVAERADLDSTQSFPVAQPSSPASE